MIKIVGKKHTFLLSLATTIIFFIMAHNYRFYNNLFSGDSLSLLNQNDSAWQISIGRIFQPLYCMFRGTVCNPWIIYVLSIVYMALSVFLVSDLFRFSSIYQISLLSGLFVCNITMTAANATYLPWVDIYCLSLFMGIFGVWLLEKKGITFGFLGVMSFVVSLGLYQAYISVAVTIVMIKLLVELTKGLTVKDFFLRLIKHFVCMLIAAVLYYLLWKGFQFVFGIWTSDSYNGLSSLGDYSEASIVPLIKLAYKQVYDYFANPIVFKSLEYDNAELSIIWVYIIRFVSVGVCIYSIVLIFRKNKENLVSPTAILLEILVMLGLPLYVNFICILSKGMVHSLMTFSYVLIFLPMIVLICHYEEKDISAEEIIACLLVFFFVWNNIVFSNQAYLKKSLQDTANLSLMTNVNVNLKMHFCSDMKM